MHSDQFAILETCKKNEWYIFEVHIDTAANSQIEIFIQLYWSNYFSKYECFLWTNVVEK